MKMTDIDATHRMKYVGAEMTRVCISCGNCYCHHANILAKKCAKAVETENRQTKAIEALEYDKGGNRTEVGTAKYFEDGRVEGIFKTSEGDRIHHIVGAMGLSHKFGLDTSEFEDATMVHHFQKNPPVKMSSKELNMNEDYQSKARRLVFAYIKPRLEKTDKHVTFAPDEVYVVWFSKTLQNWKCLISTTLPDGMYYEVTYNGDQHETYIDAYKKFDNVCIADTSIPPGYIEKEMTEAGKKLQGYLTAPRDDRPHSRACGILPHEHGRACAEDCPTCANFGEGREV